jgi:hypothetical protein
MAYAKTWLASAFVLAAGVALSGCNPSNDDSKPYPADPQTFVANYNVTTGFFPFPSDYPAYAGSTDGTLNYTGSLASAPLTLTAPLLNTLDGFSTTAPFTTSFNLPIKADTLNGSTVRVIEMYLSNSNKGPATAPPDLPVGVANPIRKVLAYGVDYTASVSDAIDSGGKILKITPLKPLTPSSGTSNIGYIVLLTNGIQDIALRSAQASPDYATARDTTNCSSITSSATLAAFCPWIKGHLAIGKLVGINPATVVLSWSFTTQSINDTFVALDKMVPAQAIVAQATAAKSPYGKANVWAGTTQVPYYGATPANANDGSFLNTFWVAAGASPVPGIDPASRWVTRFNPVPLQRSLQTIPLLLAVPNATANLGAGCTKPANGWPVVVVAHGLFGDRTNALYVADSFADACFVVAAIDQPMHGITTTTNPLYAGAIERTFNVDLANNTTGASGPDGKIDASGQHFFPTLLSNPLAGRDIFLRQAEVDLGVLAKSLTKLDLTADGVPDIDPARIHYAGMSLGGIVGAAQAKYGSAFRTVTVAAPGGLLVKLALDSPAYGSMIRSQLAAKFTLDSTVYQNFAREAQTLVDLGDPANHVCECATARPLHLIKVNGDTTVPNSATDYLINAANFARLKSGVNAVTAGKPVYVAFTKGVHDSFFNPTASPAATLEMQTEAVKFAASAVQAGGPFVTITDTTVVQQ